MLLPTASQFSNFEGHTVSAKKILYGCHLITKWNANSIESKGQIRLGPLKSNVRLETTFSDSGDWLSFYLKLDTQNYWLSYERDPKSGTILHSSSKTPKPSTIERSEQTIYDPLLMLIDVLEAKDSGTPLRKAYQTLSGPKLTVIQQKGERFYRNGKEILSLVKGAPLSLRIPQLRVQLEISKHAQMIES